MILHHYFKFAMFVFDVVVVIVRTFSMVLAGTGRKGPIPSRANKACRAAMPQPECTGAMLQYGRHMSVTAVP